MGYEVIIPAPVQKQIDNLPVKEFDKIIAKIFLLKQNPRYPGSIKLKGFKNEYRIRIGDYRIRYLIDNKQKNVILLHCGHRKDIYDK